MSIAEPPPIASRRSAAAAGGDRDSVGGHLAPVREAVSRRDERGERGGWRRAPGELEAELSRARPGSCGERPADDQDARRAGELDELARGPRLGAARCPDEEDLSRSSSRSPSTCASVSVPGGEGPPRPTWQRDEGDRRGPRAPRSSTDSCKLRGNSRRTPRSRSRTPTRWNSSSISWRTPAPSCMTIKPAPRSIVEASSCAPGEGGGRAGEGEDDLVAHERLEDHAAMASCRAYDADIPARARPPARRSSGCRRPRARLMQLGVARPGTRRGGAPVRCRPGPGRGADLEACR